MNSNFQVLDFPSTRGGKHNKDGFFCNVSRLTENHANNHYRIGFSNDVSYLINKKTLTHVQIHVETYTGSVFLVFLHGKDNVNAKITREKGGQVRICNAQLVNYLAKKMQLDGDFRSEPIELSKDLSNNDEYATFKLIFQ